METIWHQHLIPFCDATGGFIDFDIYVIINQNTIQDHIKLKIHEAAHGFLISKFDISEHEEEILYYSPTAF